MRWTTMAMAGLLMVACGKTPAPPVTPDPVPTAPDRPQAAPADVVPPPVARQPAVVIETAPPGPVAELLVARRAQLKPGQTLLLDVGAPWCEPCQRFHEAAAAGQLDAEFPNLVLVEFNWDVDRERLEAAGYVTRLIPLLAIPGPDGRATDRRLSGSIKGPGALGNLVPRLHALLDGRPVE